MIVTKKILFGDSVHNKAGIWVNLIRVYSRWEQRNICWIKLSYSQIRMEIMSLPYGDIHLLVTCPLLLLPANYPTLENSCHLSPPLSSVSLPILPFQLAITRLFAYVECFVTPFLNNLGANWIFGKSHISILIRENLREKYLLSFHFEGSSTGEFLTLKVTKLTFNNSWKGLLMFS